MSLIKKLVTRDNFVLTTVLVVLMLFSITTVVSARNAQKSADKTQTLIQRSNVNSPILGLLKDCTDPTGECAKRGAASQAAAIATITAQQACIIKESIGYDKLPDRTPAEIAEIKTICKNLLGGDALDFLRRVQAEHQQAPAVTQPLPSPTTSTTK